MAQLPNPTADAIYATYQKREQAQPRREYLGGSEIGDDCIRKLWYSFRHVHREVFDSRILRLFDSGHREEARVIEDLRAAGITVYDKDPATGDQYRYKACRGHMSGGLDGVVVGLPEAPATPHLLEVKTSNEKSFKTLEKDGLEKAQPKHYSQMQCYMGMAELTRGIYLAVNKNTDEIYTERIEAKPAIYKALLLKADSVIKAETPPERLSEDPAFFKCKFCAYSNHCHGEKVAETNCRTCVHSAPIEEGGWSCSVGGPCPVVCDNHLLIPDLIPYAKPIGGDPTFVHYRMADGREFANVAAIGFPCLDVPHYSSKELSVIDPRAIGNPAVESARRILGGEIVG